MAKNFGVEVLISTAKATKELQSAEGQVRALDRSLANLTKTLKSSNGSLEAAAKSIASIVVSSREAARASEDLAKAKIASSKADATAAAAADRHAVAQARTNQANSAAAASTALATSRTEQASRAAQNFATNQRAAASATDAMGNSLANQRYLLYDVGATYRTLALAAQALPAASLAVATSYEKNFAQVIRTSGATGTAVGELKNELKALGTEIPMTFAELSSIAQIGGQMNIATEGLAGFTKTVATFVATADGATIDSSTQAFGRLANLFATGLSGDEQAQFFEKIGSAISYTADNAVTSEAKIIATLEKISPIAAQAGFAAEEVIGLASALSSVAVPPELSSGFLVRLFGNISKDIVAGGDALDGYNRVLGTTGDEFENLYRSDPSAIVQRLAEALSGMDDIARTSALGDLGIKASRDQRAIKALSASYGVYADAMRDSNDAFESGSYLDESSVGIFNTFAANIQKLGTALMNLGDTMGSAILPVLSPIVQGITDFATSFDALLTRVPALKGLLGILMAFSSIAGIWLALKSAQAFVTAGMIGFQHVAKSGTASTLTMSGQVRMLATTMLMARGATDAQTQAMLRGASATTAMRIAMTGTIGTTNAMSSSLKGASVVATGASGTFRTLGAAMLATVGNPIVLGVTALALLGTAWYSAGQEAEASAQTMVDAAKQGGDALNEALGKQFAEEKVGLFDTSSLKLVGKTYQEIAGMANASMADISKAVGGTAEEMDAYISKLREARAARLDSGAAQPLDEEGRALEELVGKLESYRDKMTTSENATRAATEANGGLATSTGEVATAFDEASVETDDYVKSLNDAMAAAFGMVNAQGAVDASLEKLGAGLAKSASFGTDSGDGRDNLANLQANLQAQALLLQQNITNGEMTAQAASQNYASYVQGLMGELVANGVDPTQIQGLAEQALNGVRTVFDGQAVEVPLTVDTSLLGDSVTESVVGLSNYLIDNPLTATMGLVGGDETAQQAYQVVQYIAEATGLPFNAVIDAITNPASENSQAVMEYIGKITSMENTAVVNADTSAAITNVHNFAVYAQGTLSSVYSALGQAEGVFGVAGRGLLGMLDGVDNVISKVLATPGVVTAASNRAAIPSFDGLKRGYNDAAKAAGGAGKAAKGAGGAAKKAGDAGKKAGKDLGAGAKAAKKDWDEAEQAISGFASRVGNAFQYVFDATQGVQVAKDEYYSVLNGIKARLDAQRESLRGLRAENKALNAERRVQLNDAAKLEKMAKYADAMGNTERAKYYRDEAKALKSSADETKNKVDANNKEIRTVEKGIGNLKGYSQAAIENRAEIRRLEQASLDVATAYAKSGSSAKTVANATADWTKKAKDHSKQLGYSKKDIEGVTTKTSTYIDKLKKVPKTISTKITETKTTTLKVNNQTASGVSAANRAIRGIPSSKNTGIKVKESGSYNANRTINNAARDRKVKLAVQAVISGTKQMQKEINNMMKNAFGFGFASGGQVPSVKGFASGGTIPGTPPSDRNEDNLLASVDGQGMIAVRSGEFITQEPAVDYYGSDIMNKINNMDIPRYALGGGIGRTSNSDNGMSGVVDLSSETIQEIARLIERDVFLYADGEQLANTVNRGNQTIAQKGGHGVIQ